MLNVIERKEVQYQMRNDPTQVWNVCSLFEYRDRTTYLIIAATSKAYLQSFFGNVLEKYLKVALESGIFSPVPEAMQKSILLAHSHTADLCLTFKEKWTKENCRAIILVPLQSVCSKV